jgi:flagellar hook-length control protein FliK
MNGTSIIFPFAAETQQASLLHGQMNGSADGAFAESLAAALSGQAIPAQPHQQQTAASRAELGITIATGGQVQDAAGLSGNAAASAQGHLGPFNGLPIPGQAAPGGESGQIGARGASELTVGSGPATAGELGATARAAAQAALSSPIQNQAQSIGPKLGGSEDQARVLSPAASHQAVLSELARFEETSRSPLTSSQSLVVDPARARQAAALSESGTLPAGQPSPTSKAEGRLQTTLGQSHHLATSDPTIPVMARDGLAQVQTAPLPSSTEGQGPVADAETLARSAPGVLPSIASAGQARPLSQAQPSKSPSTQNDAGASQLSSTQRAVPAGGAQALLGEASSRNVDTDTADQLANASATLRNWKDASGDERQATVTTPAEGLTANRPQDASSAGDRLNNVQTTPDDQNGGPKSVPTATGPQATPLAFAAGQQGGAGQSDYQATTTGVDAAVGLNGPFEQRFDVAVDRLRAPNSPPPASAQVALQITRSIPQGIDRFSLQLQPADLGVVEIQLDIERNGQVSATITAERPETLELLQRDGRILERSLSDNGLKLSNDGLNFALKQDQHQQQHQQQGQGFNQGSEQSQASFAGTSYGDNASDEGPLPSHHRIESHRLLDIRT